MLRQKHWQCTLMLFFGTHAYLFEPNEESLSWFRVLCEGYGVKKMSRDQGSPSIIIRTPEKLQKIT